MNNLNIKQISFYGFLTIVLAIVFSAFFIYTVLSKYQQLDNQHNIYTKAYSSMLEYKYYTERLLTTNNLSKEKKLWENSKKNFKNSMDQLQTTDHIEENIIKEFYITINNESKSILKKLESSLFNEKNVMEKSILRRLGEGLNSNENSDYYLALIDLKNSIDYLKQYEGFLLEEISDLTSRQQDILTLKINELKNKAVMILLVTIIFGIVFIIFIQKLIARIELDLIETKNRLQDTLDETTHILNTSMESIMIAKNGKCIDVNKETLKTFGYDSKEELIGKSTLIFIAPDSVKLAESRQKLELVPPYEANCITKSGQIIPSLIKAYNYKNKKGEMIRVSAIVNLTQVKEQEELLFQQSKMATMGEMLENIAHQWRQPLSVISTSATGIKVQREYGVSSPQKELEALDTITNSVQHLSDTIDDFRSFFKPNKKKEEFKIADAFNRTEELMSSKLKNRDITVIKDTMDISMFGYENELIQAFMNIINNAKDALEEIDSDEKYIFFTLNQDQNNVIITIKDTAGGIPQDILPSIFKEHFTTKGDKEGTGIGLYMTQMIIEKINGTIHAENEHFQYKGKNYTGAEFTILIPRKEDIK